MAASTFCTCVGARRSAFRKRAGSFSSQASEPPARLVRARAASNQACELAHLRKCAVSIGWCALTDTVGGTDALSALPRLHASLIHLGGVRALREPAQGHVLPGLHRLARTDR